MSPIRVRCEKELLQFCEQEIIAATITAINRVTNIITRRVERDGKASSTNFVAGNPYGEQISILFKLRIDELNRQMQRAQQEKQRLEQGLK